MKYDPHYPPVADPLLCEIVQAQRFLFDTEQIGQRPDDRVADSLHVAALLVKMQRTGVSEPKVVDALLSVETRLFCLAKLCRHLKAKAGLGEVDTAPFLHELCRDLGAEIGLSCTVVAERVVVPFGVAAQLAVAVNELAVNALKHGYRGMNGGRLYLTSCRDGDGELCVVVSDYGRGLPDGFRVGNGGGLGKALVADAVGRIGGTLEAENAFGARFTIRVPLAA